MRTMSPSSATLLAHLSRKLGFHYTYIGTAYMFAYDEKHPVGGEGYKEDGQLFFS